MRRGLQRFTNETKLQRNETKLQRNETKLQRVATSCVATKRQRVATSTTPTQVRHKSFLSRRRAALVATICSLLRDKTEKQTHDVSVGLLTQYVSLLREVCFCVSPRCAIRTHAGAVTRNCTGSRVIRAPLTFSRGGDALLLGTRARRTLVPARGNLVPARGYCCKR